MGVNLLLLPRNTNLINTAVVSASTLSYTKDNRSVGVGITYTTTAAQTNNNNTNIKPTDPNCDPTEYTNKKNKVYEHLIKYLDEYSTFNFLKQTNGSFRFRYQNDEIVGINFNIVSSLERFVYVKLYPDDNFIYPDKLIIVRERIANNDY